MSEPEKIKKIRGFLNVSGFANPTLPLPVPNTQSNAAATPAKPVNKKLLGCNRRLGAPASDVTPFDRQLELPSASTPPQNAPKVPRRMKEAASRNRWRQDCHRSMTRYQNAETACLRVQEQLYSVHRQMLLKELESQDRVDMPQCALETHMQHHAAWKCMEIRLRACEDRLGLRK
ncbi:hypothetical protein BDV97DRAFT_420563 [Delphinella strobiligena]|nr:hypothetical protein BDV97DRAFT_420563 [Delphinella strobiligena]